MSTIGVGIVGFAHGHVNAYINQWKTRPDLGVAVVAGWDHDGARLAKTAESLGVRPCDDLDALLADETVQAVVVAAETSLHAELVERAAAAGKTIILQKPMAMTLAEADRIVAAVERSGVPFTLAWQMRVDPQNVAMRELLHSGTLGKIFMVRRRHGLGVHLWPAFATMWHNQPELNRDIWADDAAHAVDFLHWLLGVPETVMAEVATLHDPAVPNDNGIAVYRYPGGGPIAEVVSSFTCAAAENTTEIIAERGSIVQNYGDGPSCNVPRPEGGAHGLKWYLVDGGQWHYSDIPSPASHGERIAGLAEPLADFLHGRRPPIASADEGRLSLRMTLATYVSSREGVRVRIDDERIAAV